MRSVIDFGRFKNQVLFGDAPPTVVCRTVRPSVLERVVLQNKDTQYIFHPSDWTRDGLPSCSPNEMSRAELDGEMIAHVGNSRKVPVGECEYWGEYRPFVSASAMAFDNWRYAGYKLRAEGGMRTTDLLFTCIRVDYSSQLYTHTHDLSASSADDSRFNLCDIHFLDIYSSLNSEIIYYPRITASGQPFMVTYDELMDLLPSAERDGAKGDFPDALERLRTTYTTKEESKMSHSNLLELEDDLKKVELGEFDRLLEAMEEQELLEGSGLGAAVFGLLPLYEIFGGERDVMKCRMKLISLVEGAEARVETMGEGLHEAWRVGVLALQSLP